MSKEHTSDFLRDAEFSAKEILRKNNELRTRDIKGILEEQKSHHYPSVSMRVASGDVKVSSFSTLDAHPKLNPYSSKTKKDKTLLGMDEVVDQAKKALPYTDMASRCKTRNKFKVTNRKGLPKKADLILDSSALRKRFRCDQISAQEGEQNVEKLADARTNGPSCQNQRPIQALVSQHIESIRERSRTAIRRKLSRISESVSDSHRKSLEMEMSCEVENACAAKKMKVLSGGKTYETIDSCQQSSTEAVSALKKNQNHRTPSNYSNGCNKVSESISVCEKTKDAESFSKLEHWLLVVQEPISVASTTEDHYYAMSVSRMQGSLEQSKESSLRWIIDFYSRTKIRTRRCILNANEMSALLSLQTRTEKQRASLTTKIVYKEDVVKNCGGVDFEGVCIIRVQIGGREVRVSMSFKLTCDGRKEEDPLELNLELPIYEIIASLGLQSIRKALDCEYWLSECNREFIWSPLIKKTNLMKKKESDELFLQPFMLQRGCENIASRGYSNNMPSSEYREALKISHKILYALVDESGTSRRTLISYLNQDILSEENRLVSISELQRQAALPSSLSLRLTKSLAFSKSLVPGSCSIGTIGAWWNEDNMKDEDDILNRLDTRDDTQVALSLHKKKTNESFSNVTTVRLALETPIPGPIYNVLPPGPMIPDLADHDPVDGSIPALMAEYSVLLSEPLISALDSRIPTTLRIVDVRSKLPEERQSMNVFPPIQESEEPIFTEHGYRLIAPAQSIHHKSSFPLFTFGISDKGVLRNSVGVSKRTIWYSEEVCTQLLSQPRGSGDFFHMIQNKLSGKDGGSPNDPLASTIFMKAYKMKEVIGQKMIVRKKNRLKRAKALQDKRKKETLQKKIEAADMILKSKSRETGNIFVELQDNVTINERGVELKPERSTPYWTNKETVKGYDGKRYPDKTVGVNFFKLKNCKVRGFEKCHLVDRCNQPQMIGMVETSKVIEFKIDAARFQTKMHTEFIGDLLEDRFQLSHKKTQEKQNKDILLDSDQQTALEHILKVPLENTTLEENERAQLPPEDQVASMNAGVLQEKMKYAVEDSKSNNVEQVIQATRHANYESLEELLDDLGIEVDSSDEHGNTLLILAGQQGNKKLCKFLLRRGAYINAQNHAGNTILHYLYEYRHVDLAEYLMRKGADDSYINAEGLTCYEGVKLDNIAEM